MKKILKWLFFLFLGFIALSIIVAIFAPESEDTTVNATRTEDTGTPVSSTPATEDTPEDTPFVAPSATPTPIDWISVTASDILTTYDSNEIAGQQTFADKPLAITGDIGRPDYAPLTNKRRYRIPIHADSLDISISLLALHCDIPVNDENTAWVSGLAEGDTVMVHGYIRDDMRMGILDVKDCTPVYNRF